MIDDRDGHIVFRFGWDDGTASILEYEETAHEAPWADAIQIDRFTHARLVEQGGDHLLIGRNDQGYDVVLSVNDVVSLGDADVHYDPETGTASVQAEYGDRPGDDAFDPNLDPHLGQSTWYRFTLPTGQELLRAAGDVVEADWEGASEVDVFRQARWEPTRDRGWLLFGTKDTGQRLPIHSLAGQGAVDLTSPGQAAFDAEGSEVLTPRDVGEESTASSRVSTLVDRIRNWLQRDRDQGMER